MMGGGGAPEAPAGPKPDVKEILCLDPLVDQEKSECLNEDTTSNFQNVFTCDTGTVLRSDCDEQLLMNIYFRELVKVHHLVINTVDSDKAPKALCIYINRAPLDFDDTETVEADQGLELTDSELQGEETILDYVKYQAVNSLTIFVPENRGGGEVSEIASLQIYGTPLNTANMKDLKKVG